MGVTGVPFAPPNYCDDFGQGATPLKLGPSSQVRLIVTNCSDRELLKAFGITREARQLKQKLAKTDDEQDWDKYDVPPKMR